MHIISHYVPSLPRGILTLITFTLISVLCTSAADQHNLKTELSCNFSNGSIDCFKRKFVTFHFAQTAKACLMHGLRYDGVNFNASNDVNLSPKILNISSNTLDHFMVISESLETLDLSQNQLQSLEGSFVFVPKLISFFARNNKLKVFSMNFLIHSSFIRILDLRNNQIISLTGKFNFFDRPLDTLLLDGNNLTDYVWMSNVPAKSLSLAKNPVHNTQLGFLPDLLYFNLISSLFTTISPYSFANVTNLQKLTITYQSKLSYIGSESLHGLHNLVFLNLSHNFRMSYIHKHALVGLNALEDLDLRYNNLFYLHPHLAVNIYETSLFLAGNVWMCKCEISWFSFFQNITKDEPMCGENSDNCYNMSVQTCLTESFACSPSYGTFHSVERIQLGRAMLLDCPAFTSVWQNLTWTLPTGQHIAFIPGISEYESWADYDGSHTYQDPINHILDHNKVYVKPDGRLYMTHITRSQAGQYKCEVSDGLNQTTVVFQVRLDYSVLSKITINCVIVAFSTAGVLLIFGIIVCLSNHMAYKLSPKEQEKRNSIRKVLEDMNNYRHAQIGRIQAYSCAKIDKFSAFKTCKIDALRTYKTATLTSVLEHMQGMREQYTTQVNKIRANCTAKRASIHQQYVHQAERFRGYKMQKIDRLKGYRNETVGKLRDYKSERLEKLKENYNSQVQKVRDYGTQQVSKLREQYKTQQQYLLKLLELLDIGHCFTVIEEECRNTESEIFKSIDIADNVLFELDTFGNYTDAEHSFDYSVTDDSPLTDHAISSHGNCENSKEHLDIPMASKGSGLSDEDSDSQSSFYFSLPVSRTASPENKPSKVQEQKSSEIVLDPITLDSAVIEVNDVDEFQA